MSIPDLDEALVQSIRQDAFADGVDFERERIIKLLDEVIYSWDNELRVSSDFDTFQDLIALIKGEK